ncbi:tRNA (adenosine(37)-N6)-threonylcarbamoyltransferase complex ATPase subunit type 1 TsaE [Roseicitreum antarcticum]|uniref:tRNA threonylcarbamoyladenosine biosynthesis protein TsaE n=1 Tax=Roseicitreum antarcticum TaxID=564137 RepID=A0A1H2R1C8_9RHOB|nr:tRNA (adenosine(37)-N6)-threonylcarbamoyltransferase complex ATPase subunit type 1 TsaE [Roseicitreum antarcticum]SDW12998.1 tRNA threonylcarbamoyladenosine biosynthesis protein TsaE [Roseicitreum antarcticum]
MTHTRHLILPTPDATDIAAHWIAPRLHAGDVILLSGPVGAGKTHFARKVIRYLQGEAAEDVPSPTFTIVQTYEARALEIWHADLYRLTHPDEVLELGLEDAFHTALCLVEWPDRLAEPPPGALHLAFSYVAGQDDARALDIFADAPRWAEVIDGFPAA